MKYINSNEKIILTVIFTDRYIFNKSVDKRNITPLIKIIQHTNTIFTKIYSEKYY